MKMCFWQNRQMHCRQNKQVCRQQNIQTRCRQDKHEAYACDQNLPSPKLQLFLIPIVVVLQNQFKPMMPPNNANKTISKVNVASGWVGLIPFSIHLLPSTPDSLNRDTF